MSDISGSRTPWTICTRAEFGYGTSIQPVKAHQYARNPPTLSTKRGNILLNGRAECYLFKVLLALKTELHLFCDRPFLIQYRRWNSFIFFQPVMIEEVVFWSRGWMASLWIEVKPAMSLWVFMHRHSTLKDDPEWNFKEKSALSETKLALPQSLKIFVVLRYD